MTSNPMKRAVHVMAIMMIGVLPFCAVRAQTLRVAVATDAVTLDPHAFNIGTTTLVTRQIYEPLVFLDEHQERRPALALSWSAPSATVWRFQLRPNVRFQDGSRFDADDVVFSLARSREGFADFGIYSATVSAVRKIDPLTVEFDTAGPDPSLPEKLSRVFIMDSEWAAAHGLQHVLDPKGGSGAGSRANGTGPYRVVSDASGATELVRNESWWGGRPAVANARFVAIPSDGARIAALVAGDVDVVLDVPPQLADRVAKAANLRIEEATENRTIFLAMDVFRDELLYSDITGRNPFKDVRVRRAVSLALDRNAIKERLMEGHSLPAALMWAPAVHGYVAKDDAPSTPDPARARALLAEAGYPTGFGVALDCPNDRYVNDEQICQAIASALARVNIRVTVKVQPMALLYGRMRKFDTSFYMLGWAPATFDPQVTLTALLHSIRRGYGSNNFGRYGDPRLDQLIEAIETEMDHAHRMTLIRKAGLFIKDEVPTIPIHHQAIIWAMKKSVSAAIPAENQLDLKKVALK